MSSFTEGAVEQKLSTLNDSTESIQTVSHWLAYHQKHFKTYVDVWSRVIRRAQPAQMLRILYVANDLIQVNRKKLPHIVNEFGRVFPEALPVVVQAGDDKIRKAVRRVVDVWAERQLFEQGYLQALQRRLDEASTNPPLPTNPAAPEPVREQQQQPTALSGELHEIITLYEALERAAAEDNKTLEQVRALPEHIFTQPEKSTTKAQLEDDVDILSSAGVALAKAEGRLDAQIEDRQKLIELMTSLLQHQRTLHARALSAMEELRLKSSKVTDLRKTIKTRMDQVAAASLFGAGPPPMLSSADIFEGPSATSEATLERKPSMVGSPAIERRASFGSDPFVSESAVKQRQHDARFAPY